MSQNPPTQERLQEIRDTDAMSGEDLRFCPVAWRDRRELLAYIDALISTRENDALAVAALSGMLEPYSGGTSDLHDLVARMHQAREITAKVRKESARQASAVNPLDISMWKQPPCLCGSTGNPALPCPRHPPNPQDDPI